MSSEGPACRSPLPSPESLTWLETFTLPGPGQQQRQHLGQPGSLPTLPHLIWAWMSAAMKKTPTPPQHRSARARPPSPAERSPARGLKGARKTGLSLSGKQAGGRSLLGYYDGARLRVPGVALGRRRRRGRRGRGRGRGRRRRRRRSGLGFGRGATLRSTSAPHSPILTCGVTTRS